MDFIELPTAAALNPGLGAILIVAGIFVVIIGVMLALRLQTFNALAIISIALVISAAIVTTIVVGPSLLLPSSDHRKQNAEFKSAVEDAYGISLSDRAVRYLEYPDSKPTEALKEFGYKSDVLIPKGDSFEKQRITLVWSDGKMLLAQTSDDGKLTPLELKR